MARNEVVGWDESISRKENPYGVISAKQYKKDSSVLLIDARLMSYAVFHTRKLSTSGGICTSVLHGIIEQVQGLCDAANTRRWCLVWDGLPSYRRRIFAGYKMRQDRDRTLEEAENHRRLLRSMETAREVGDRLGWPQACLSEVEADDLIGVFSQVLLRRAIQEKSIIERVIMITEDKDYYQLIRRDQLVVYRHRFGEVINQKSLLEIYGLTPTQYIDYKALMGEGEDGDNIPHAEGIGEKTARKLIGLHKSIPNLHQHLQELFVKTSGKLTTKDASLFHNQDITHRAYLLSRILTRPSELAKCYPGQRNKLIEEWNVAHGQLVKSLRIDRPMYLRDIASLQGKYEFDSFDPQSWARSTGYKISI